MGTREAMIAQAEKSLGLGEPNYIQSWYCSHAGICGNFAWCDAGITYWAYHSDNVAEVCFGNYYAYTVWHAQRFQAAGRWHTDVAGIRRGDIVFYDWDYSNSVGAIDHIGIVTDVKGSAVYTIEGNTANVCARRVRYASTIVGYGRPDYDDADTDGPATAGTYVVRSGDTLGEIAARFGVSVLDLLVWNADLLSDPDVIEVGWKLKVTAHTQPEPVPDPPYSPPAFPAGIRPNSARPSAKRLQAALQKAGYMPDSVERADNYGPQTQAAVARFYAAHRDLSTASYDPVIGPKGWAALFREAYA